MCKYYLLITILLIIAFWTLGTMGHNSYKYKSTLKITNDVVEIIKEKGAELDRVLAQ